jgi:tetratricopeptide (TPR) repeat protein
LNNLAGLLEKKGDYGGAKPLYRRALAIREKVLGAQHPDTATSLNNLAFLLYFKGDYNDAEPLFRRALAIAEQVLGHNHPNTVIYRNNLASLLNLKINSDGNVREKRNEKVSRNAPCPCGSGKRYKHCCGKIIS